MLARNKMRAMSCCFLLVFVAGAALPAQVKIELKVPLAELERIARIDSTDVGAQYDLGLGYWSKKRFDEADRALRRAVAIEPQFAPAYLALAYLPLARRPQLLKELARGRASETWREVMLESERFRRRAFLIDPLVDVRIIGAAMRRTGAIPPRRSWYSDPFASYISGDYLSSFNTLGMLIQRFPGASLDSVPDELLWYRGLAAGHLGRYDRAISDLTVLLERAQRLERSDTVQLVAPRTNEYRYFMAFFQYKAQRFALALDLYREALGQDAGLYMAHVQMGRIFQTHKLWDEAVIHFQHAAEANPDDASILVELALAQWEAAQIGAAIATLQQAQAANPLDSRVPYFLGRLQQERGDAAAARQALTRFLSLAPRTMAEQIADARRRLAGLPGPP